MVSEPPKRWIGTGFLSGSGIYLNQLRTGILGVYLHKSLREEREEREEPETWEAFVCNAIRKHLETDSWTGLQEDSEVRDVLFIVIGLQLLHFGPFEAWNAQLEMEISKSHGTVIVWLNTHRRTWNSTTIYNYHNHAIGVYSVRSSNWLIMAHPKNINRPTFRPRCSSSS